MELDAGVPWLGWLAAAPAKFLGFWYSRPAFALVALPLALLGGLGVLYRRSPVGAVVVDGDGGEVQKMAAVDLGERMTASRSEGGSPCLRQGDGPGAGEVRGVSPADDPERQWRRFLWWPIPEDHKSLMAKVLLQSTALISDGRFSGRGVRRRDGSALRLPGSPWCFFLFPRSFVQSFGTAVVSGCFARVRGLFCNLLL